MKARSRYAVVVFSALLWLAMAAPSYALLPALEGTIDLAALEATPGAFGIPDGTGQTFVASLKAVYGDGSVFPSDGVVRVQVTDFFLEIGDTFWDETMTPPGRPLFFDILFGDGSVRGVAGEITPYNPAHPDFFLLLPASPGTWQANDIRTIIDPETGREVTIDRGVIAGTYVPNLVVVPLPGTLGLLGLGLVLVATGSIQARSRKY